MPLINSTSMREQVPNPFKELAEIRNKSWTLFLALIAATNSETRKSLVLVIVLYSFLVIIGTILQLYNRSLLPIITCAMLVLGCAVSVVASSIVSPTIAWITLALWVGVFALVAYDYDVHQRIKNWIEGRITRSSELLPQQRN